MKLLDSKMYMEDIRYVAECNFSWDKLRDKKILITGACGLIGSFAIDVLMKQNKFCDMHWDETERQRKSGLQITGTIHASVFCVMM